jgi:hypothetical protein
MQAPARNTLESSFERTGREVRSKIAPGPELVKSRPPTSDSSVFELPFQDELPIARGAGRGARLA